MDNYDPDTLCGSEPQENYLTAEESALFARLGSDQIDRYLEAVSSPEAMQAYLNDPDNPPAAKALMDMAVWEGKPRLPIS